MALGSTQPLTEMSTRRISWGGKCGRCVWLTTLPPPCAVVMKFGNLNFLEPSGPLQACNGTALPLPYKLMNKNPKQLLEIRKIFNRPHSIRGLTMHGQFTSYTRINFIYSHIPTYPFLFMNILTHLNA